MEGFGNKKQLQSLIWNKKSCVNALFVKRW